MKQGIVAVLQGTGLQLTVKCGLKGCPAWLLQAFHACQQWLNLKHRARQDDNLLAGGKNGGNYWVAERSLMVSEYCTNKSNPLNYNFVDRKWKGKENNQLVLCTCEISCGNQSELEIAQGTSSFSHRRVVQMAVHIIWWTNRNTTGKKG